MFTVRYNVHIMNSKNIISITEARKNLFNIVQDVNTPDTSYILTERGRAKAIIMSVEEFEGWQETMELLYAYPNLPEELKEAKAQIKRGEFITLDELKKSIDDEV